MTREQAQRTIDELQGWTDPRIDEDDDGYCTITAVDPSSHRRLRYDPDTGFFN